MVNTLLITSAAAFAAEAHKNCVRKELNEPYIVHPARVAKMAAQLGLPDTDIAACYIHDVPEDTNVPMATIEQLFPTRTVTLVRALTKWWEDGHPSEVVAANKAAYYYNIVKTDGALTLKFLDRIDNLHDFTRMARMSPSNHKWAEKYHTKTLAEFEPLKSQLTGGTATQVRSWYNNAVVNLECAL